MCTGVGRLAWLGVAAHVLTLVVAMTPYQGVHAPPRHRRSRMAQWRDAQDDDAAGGGHDHSYPMDSIGQRRFALLTAAGGGDVTQAEGLLYSGAQIVNRERDLSGKTALHHAAVHGHAAMVALLLKYGADVDAVENTGRTGLIEAARGGYVEACQLLMEAGAQLDAVDHYGNSALHYASSESYNYGVAPSSGHEWPVVPTDGIRRSKHALGYRESEREARHGLLVELLIQAGALINGTNNAGERPFVQGNKMMRYDEDYSDQLESKPFNTEYQKDGADDPALDYLGRNYENIQNAHPDNQEPWSRNEGSS